MATGLENLWVYKLAEDLEILVYEITKGFPRDEFYRSIDQLKRSSASVANNIAESYHKSSAKEKIRFIDIAMGEAEETKRNLIRSFRKGFVKEDSKQIVDEYTKLLNGLGAYRKFLLLGKIKPKP
ncbi:MAG: four helix bundle protein [Candidatus Sungiibacteriota bacterium]|uniref:Four helix bundle protein n=1 Tax=Candidatus Sungiibacteriota bacterium TaxID=2750080 RepID=A0A7T5UR04_9BACT|nr:MAG: four helix bundle protein [Candidatus Sungbacteria bacterium]